MMRFLGGLVSAGLSALAVIGALIALPARADVQFLSVPASGTSAAGNPVSFRATFTVSGSNLSVVLTNTSLVPTQATDDVLSSFYFDVLQCGVRPHLQATAASGLVYKVVKGGSDVFAPGGLPGGATDLRAIAAGAGTWQFRTMDAARPPLLGFGIGTVGNSVLSPNNFNPKIVNQADYALYSTGKGTDIDPVGNLVGRLLVRGTAAFTFTGLDPKLPVCITDKFVFGLGTSPDSTIVVSLPEPAAAALLVPGTLLVLVTAWIRRRQAAAPRPRPGGDVAS